QRQGVDLAHAAMVEVSGVGVVDAVLALPPAVWSEQQVAEQVTPPAVGLPRGEHRVVREVMEQRVHAGEEYGRDQAEGDSGRGARLEQGGEDPDGQVGQDDARYLP